MKNQPEHHPNIIDRNRAILLCRDLLSVNDWVILAIKTSRQLEHRVIPGDAEELVTVSVLGPNDKVLMDMLIRPDGAVNSELLHTHGSNQVKASNAPSFAEVHKILNAGFRKTRVLCFHPNKIKETLSTLCQREKLPALEGSFVDVQLVYSRFVGAKESDTAVSYIQQDLGKHDCSRAGVPAIAECRHILHLLQEMAASDQQYDSATAFNKGWSATFYKPKHGPAEKLKELLGLGE